MYSRTLLCTLCHEARMQIGVSSVLSSTKSTETPSTPMR